MLIHEFQARRLLFDEGIDSPAGRVASSAGGAEAAFLDLAPPGALVKGQVVGSGRREAGLIRKAAHPHEVREAAAEMLARQDSSTRRPLHRDLRHVLVVEEVSVLREIYVRARIAPASGELLVEVLGASPGSVAGALAAERFLPRSGLKAYQARKLAAAAGVDSQHRAGFCKVLTGLSRAVAKLDAESIELHPVALAEDGRVLALDAKIAVDDRAAFRHPEIRLFYDGTEEDLRVLRARRCGLNFVPLAGDVACVASGLDLAAASADAVTVAGGQPACLLELGALAGPTQISEAFRLLSGEAALRSVVLWLFELDLAASGTAGALEASVEALSAELPVAVHVSGPGCEGARRLVSEMSPGPVLCETLAGAAALAVRPEEAGR